MDNQKVQRQFNSLTDIREQKELLRESIEADDARIKDLWDSLFRIPDVFSKQSSQGKRLKSLFSLGVNTVDCALLAWKLYRKFKRR